MKNKKIIIGAIVIILFFLVWYFLKDKKEEQIFFEVKRGDIVKDIFESGVLNKGEEINLGFKTAGRIGEIYVKTGEKVKKGDVLGNLDSDDLKIQLEKAKRAFQISMTELEKARAGFSDEEIETYKVAVSNARSALESSNSSFSSAEKSLIAQMEDSYTKSDDAISGKIDKFFLNPKSESPQFEVSITDGSTVYSFPVPQNQKSEINNGRIKVEDELEKIRVFSKGDNPLLFVDNVENSLKEIISFLDKVAFAINSFSVYSLSYEATLSQYRTDISTARSAVSLSLSNLLSSKNSFNSANAALVLSKGNLKQSESQLNLALKGARDEDIKILESRVKQMESEVNLVQKYIEDSSIRAFSDGIITDVKKKKGEIIQPGESLFSFLGENNFQVEANIYEGEISRIDLYDTASVELVAFPNLKFEGRVVSIEPSSRIIDGVVYYRIWIDVENLPEKAMPGMTSDIIINTLEKENVLIIPEASLQKMDGKVFVKVLSGKKSTEEREVEVGSRGDGRIIEIISGLKEGEKVLVK
ncbi:MAG: efflux RND transporter periplasmic adaptor subunit [Candidatus Pacebacteria bacterium]|nr:efflux RND transporter periplasmic adaptor subunit [Candidatus Paceibacterota bacterium]